MNWWIYAIVIGGIIIVYLLTGLIIKLLMRKAQKRAFTLLEQLLPKERERFEVIYNTKLTMENDGRYLPKNLTETIEKTKKEFENVPVDMSIVKGYDDFLIIYFRKYISEKRLMEKYRDLDSKLEAILYTSLEDKSSPYYEYNKAALKYNSYLNMGVLNIFRGKAIKAPTL